MWGWFGKGFRGEGAAEAGGAVPLFRLEEEVPADHPLRVVKPVLDDALARAGAEVERASARLGSGADVRELAALSVLDVLYDAAEPGDVVDLLHHDLAARWLIDWPEGPAGRRRDELASAIRQAAEDPLVLMVRHEVLGADAVTSRLGDRRWRVDPRRLRAVRRRGRWATRRLRPGRARRWLGRTVRGTLVVGGGAAIALAVYAGTVLPSSAEISALLGQPTMAVELDGGALDRGRVVMPVPVDRATLPEAFMAMLLTAEDRRFYYHPGFDFIGMARAAQVYVMRRLGLSDSSLQGASTLTQQLVKNALLSSEQTLRRKFDELLLAIKLELLFTKDELLELYLANAYFGGGVHGLELAARRYFGRRARELEPHEAALLVSLLPSPENFRPDLHWTTARARAIGLLRRTAEAYPAMAASMAAAERRLAAVERFADLERGSRPFRSIQHRYFRDWVLADLAERFAGAEGAHRLVLTLDPLAQIYAQLTVERLIRSGRRAGFDEAAVVVLAPDGRVLAMVGGRDYGSSQFSRATQARRQPGSAFKPIVYLAALEAGFEASSIVEDKPFAEGGWPRNYRGGHRGKVTLETAFSQSLNGAAVQLAEMVGRERVIATARRLGLDGPLPDEPSVTLGVGEVTLLDLARVFAVFANGGLAVEPKGALALRSNDGRTVAWADPPAAERLIETKHVLALNRLLRSVVAPGGSGNAANLDGHVAGKTGTTQFHRDAWFFGFTGDVVIGIWVGNDDRRPMAESVAGGTLPAAAFANLLANLRADVLAGQSTPPPGL